MKSGDVNMGSLSSTMNISSVWLGSANTLLAYSGVPLAIVVFFSSGRSRFCVGRSVFMDLHAKPKMFSSFELAELLAGFTQNEDLLLFR